MAQKCPTGVRDAANIAMIAQKIVQAVRAPCDIRLREGTLSARLKASVGISTYQKDGATAEELINSADMAMFRAK